MEKIIEFFTLDPSNPVIFGGQIVGFISLAFGLINYLFTKREHILIIKILSDLTSSIQLFMFGAIVGGSICFLNISRSLVFYHKGSKRWASHILVPVIFGILTVGCSVIGWIGWLSLLPTIGSILAIIGYWCSDPRLLKLINLPAIALWLIYNIKVGSIGPSISNTVAIITITVSLCGSLIAYIKSRRNTSSEEISAVKDETPCTD